MSEPDQQKLWLKEQKREDVIEEIVYNSKKTNLTHLRRIGWTNGFPVSLSMQCYQSEGKKRGPMQSVLLKVPIYIYIYIYMCV
jgi:hypothetical protein